MPFEDNQFDLVYAFATMEHVPRIEPAFKEMARVLAPGGFMYSVASPLWNSPQGHHKSDFFQDYPWIHLRMSAEGILEFCRKQGISDPGGTAMEAHIAYMLDPRYFNRTSAHRYLEACNRLDGMVTIKNALALEDDALLSDAIWQELEPLGYDRKDLLAVTHIYMGTKMPQGLTGRSYALRAQCRQVLRSRGASLVEAGSILRQLLERFPRLKRGLRGIYRSIRPASVSGHYKSLEGDSIELEGLRLRGAWKDSSIPRRQRVLVDGQLKDYRAGVAIPVFDTLVRALRSLPLAPGASLLEVGCSSGYYSEVLKIAGLDLRYSGCDYSPTFVEMARSFYPQHEFDNMDATRLRYSDGQFDVVVSGCCLLHIPEYHLAVAETARVARTYAIFHRTPVLRFSPTRHFTKEAYGVQTIELHFNEQELLRLFSEAKLRVIDIATLSEEPLGDDIHAVRTYVCQKTST